MQIRTQKEEINADSDRKHLVFTSVAEPELVEPKLFWDLEPEPKINFNKHFLQSVVSSVSDPYSSNPDPAKNLNPDPDPGRP